MNSKKEIRVAIIGVGLIGQQHLQKYAEMDNVTIAAICDIDAEKLQKYAAEYKVADTYVDYRELLRRDDLDSVDVCLHNNLHAPIAIDVMRSGKNCYCEKPMAGAYKDAAAMQEASRHFGKLLHIQLSFLYGYETLQAKKLIDLGYLGKPYHARSIGFRRRGRPFVDGYGEKEFNTKYMAGGGALFDMGVYRISQILYLLGMPKIERISGAAYREVEIPERELEISKFDVEELGVGFVKCENGLTIDVLESWAIYMDDLGSSFIAGDKGGIKIQPLEYFTTSDGMTMNTKIDSAIDSYRDHRHCPEVPAYDSSQKHWVAALRGEVELIDTPEIALQTMLLSEGIYLSGRLGREVTADEVIEMSESIALTHQPTDFGEITYKPYPFFE